MTKEVKKESKEKLQQMKIALIVCMDDAIMVDKDAYIVGIGGSGIIAEKPSDKISQPQLNLINRVRGPLMAALKVSAIKLKVNLGITSHPGCGWAKLMGRDDPRQTTADLAKDFQIAYAGHLKVGEEPELTQETERPVNACITRGEDKHEHEADKIILTTGGFITQVEKDKIGPRAFIISADWVSDAMKFHLNQQDALDFLQLQINVAREIMHNPNLPVEIYNSGRISDNSSEIIQPLVSPAVSS
jgi:hypothetical protein